MRARWALWMILAVALGAASCGDDDAGTTPEAGVRDAAARDSGGAPVDAGMTGAPDGALDMDASADDGGIVDVDAAIDFDAAIDLDAGAAVTDGGASSGSITSIAAGDVHTCASRSDGTAWCWGDNTYGQLGDGTRVARSAPTSVLTGVASVAGGGAHSCAILASGGAMCWGDNASGQLGDGSRRSSTTPVIVSGLGGAAELALGGGYKPPSGPIPDIYVEGHSCVRRVDGTVSCWGDNAVGQLGNGRAGGDATRPALVSGVTDAVDIAAGLRHTCVVRGTDGSVLCWGNNEDAELGQPRTITASGAPLAVPGLSNVVAVGAGGKKTCVLRSDGSVACWGLNECYLELFCRVATTVETPTPIMVPPSVVDVTFAWGHGCVMQAGGVDCWGANYAGQVGDGTMSSRSNPVPVVGLAAPAIAITVGGAHTCAALGDGTAACWGLLDGTATPSPVSVVFPAP